MTFAKDDLTNLYPTSPEPYFGEWARTSRWVLRKKRYEATFSRMTTDNRQPQMLHPDMSPHEIARAKKTWIPRPPTPQTALVSILPHRFGNYWTPGDIAGQLWRADETEQAGVKGRSLCRRRRG